jgi:hypothetical protein
MMPGRSTSSADSSAVHGSDSQTGAGSSGSTAYILPATLKTKSFPHCTFSVLCARERQYCRTVSISMPSSVQQQSSPVERAHRAN